MKALSIRQPWAGLIIDGAKDIENRTWKTEVRGRVLVHSSKTVDEISVNDSCWRWVPMAAYLVYTSKPRRGVILGSVSIIDCVDDSSSPWFSGPYAFVLSKPIKFENPIPCRGQLGFWTPPKDVWPPEVEDGDL